MELGRITEKNIVAPTSKLLSRWKRGKYSFASSPNQSSNLTWIDFLNDMSIVFVISKSDVKESHHRIIES